MQNHQLHAMQCWSLRKEIAPMALPVWKHAVLLFMVDYNDRDRDWDSSKDLEQFLVDLKLLAFFYILAFLNNSYP